MSKEFVKKFRKDLEENEELKEKLKKELEAFKDSDKKEKELIPEIARKLGYDFTDEEFKEEFSKPEEVNDEELANVSGGALWQGEDAPDGHEMNCLLFYYFSWQHYYWNNDICENCKSTNIETIGVISRLYFICKDCGHRTDMPDTFKV